MTSNCDHSVARKTDRIFSLTRTSGPFPGTVAFIKPILGRTGGPTGWELKPLVTMQGAKSKIWETADEAIASTKIMTLAAAKRAVTHASGLTGGAQHELHRTAARRAS
jgi:hypothetical protein